MIGIIGAMAEEVKYLQREMEEKEMKTFAGMEFCKGKIEDKEVVVVVSGIGKVNAAVCTQLLVDVYHVDCVINSGVAGSLDARIDIGDIVISTDGVHHDIDCSAVGDPVGVVPRMGITYFPADERLIQLAVSANEKVNPDIATFTGRIASGDQFIASSEKKHFIVEHFQASCAEMEGASILHTAYLNQVPCVVIRAISDKADGSAKMDYPEFEKMAIRHCHGLTKELIRTL